jgi:hypothetical protein
MKKSKKEKLNLILKEDLKKNKQYKKAEIAKLCSISISRVNSYLLDDDIFPNVKQETDIETKYLLYNDEIIRKICILVCCIDKKGKIRLRIKDAKNKLFRNEKFNLLEAWNYFLKSNGALRKYIDDIDEETTD